MQWEEASLSRDEGNDAKVMGGGGEHGGSSLGWALSWARGTMSWALSA